MFPSCLCMCARRRPVYIHSLSGDTASLYDHRHVQTVLCGFAVNALWVRDTAAAAHTHTWEEIHILDCTRVQKRRHTHMQSHTHAFMNSAMHNRTPHTHTHTKPVINLQSVSVFLLCWKTHPSSCVERWCAAEWQLSVQPYSTMYYSFKSFNTQKWLSSTCHTSIILFESLLANQHWQYSFTSIILMVLVGADLVTLVVTGVTVQAV